jgi:20S proteasome alpha/beta subunit
MPRVSIDGGCFIGLTADGRILIDKARIECQSHRLTVEDPVSIEYITKHVAGIQQVMHLRFYPGIKLIVFSDIPSLEVFDHSASQH